VTTNIDREEFRRRQNQEIGYVENPAHRKLMTLSAFMVCATLGWVHIHPQGSQAKVEEDCAVCICHFYLIPGFYS